MKKIMFCLALMACFFASSQAQQINGSGTVVQVPVSGLGTFTRLKIVGIPGASWDNQGKTPATMGISIAVGAPATAISIAADDNLAPYFAVKQEGDMLSIGLPANRNNRLWMEGSNIRIQIALPILESLSIETNMDAEVTGLNQQQLKVDKSGNGDLRLTGKVTDLTLTKTGNGSVDMEQLYAQKAEIKSIGNGDVSVWVSEELQATRSGNGNIIQYGSGNIKKKLDRGNGVTVNQAAVADYGSSPFVHLNLVNTRHRGLNLEFRGREKRSFSYGIRLNAYELREEDLPVGTQIRTRWGRLLHTVSTDDAGASIEL
jgi:Putative auto-transporter adhesin, head GIN domain